jgi:hypothetical protein
VERVMRSPSARTSISKKLRFEVFKRDSFRCQYCGAAAPDVLLEIDHLKAVTDGGTNDILNLVTACKSCNAGKGNRALSAQCVLERQRDQLAELNERREQLEMMIQWKEELSHLKDTAIDRVSQFWSTVVPGFSLNENGRQSLKKLTTRFEIDEIMDAMRIASDQYLEYANGNLVPESVENAWSKVSGICRVRRTEKVKPYIRDLLYIRGILRKRLFYVNEQQVMGLLEDAHLAGASIENLMGLAKDCKNWTEFRDEIYQFLSPSSHQNS